MGRAEKGINFLLESETNLERVDRSNEEDSACVAIAKGDVQEGDDLDALTQSHAMRQNAAETHRLLKLLAWLDQILVQKADSTHLHKIKENSSQGSHNEQENKIYWINTSMPTPLIIHCLWSIWV